MIEDPAAPPLYLNSTQVQRLVQRIDPIQIIKEALILHATGETTLPDEAYLAWTNANGEPARSLNMPGYLAGELQVAGTKIINANPSNPSRSLPRASGLTLLFDTLTARILCIMDAAYISAMRTAAISGICAEVFGAGAIRDIAVLGTGALAAAHVHLLTKTLQQLERIWVFDIARERALLFAARESEALASTGVSINVTEDPKDCVGHAEMVIATTTTTTGYIHFDWLQSGSILVNISLDDPLPEVFMKSDKIFVDDWSLIKADTRRILGKMYREGSIGGLDDQDTSRTYERRINGSLGDVLLGRVSARDRATDVILVNPFGMSIEDLAIGIHVYRAALDVGLGTRLEL
jgi:N-[(2S)-2-amino-2-carboxyethyl]-L-glutamate dehydrogenase